MEKLSWKDKLWLVMEGMGFVFLYVGIPLLAILAVLEILSHIQ
jgi:Na+-transporting methylmalonyl-CoA/oxaloacetate decarboxylase gamma subunit